MVWIQWFTHNFFTEYYFYIWLMPMVGKLFFVEVCSISSSWEADNTLCKYYVYIPSMLINTFKRHKKRQSTAFYSYDYEEQCWAM